jgi:hypothetical protein
MESTRVLFTNLSRTNHSAVIRAVFAPVTQPSVIFLAESLIVLRNFVAKLQRNLGL